MNQSRTVRKDVEINKSGIHLVGDLAVPYSPQGVVLFAHSSGSSRRSPKIMAVAHALNESGLATLLFDLLSPEEASDRDNVYDISLLARRLSVATEWVEERPELLDLPLGFFGAGTGTAAALESAAELGARISAIVSRGGRPDLALASLEFVTAQTLLIVGGGDQFAVERNKKALPLLRKSELIVMEDPLRLDETAEEAAQWFGRFLRSKKPLRKIA